MNKRFEPIIFSVLMSVFMTIPVAFVMTLVNVGWSVRFFFQAFLMSSLLGLAVSIPVAFIAFPLVSKMVAAIFKEGKKENHGS